MSFLCIYAYILNCCDKTYVSSNNQNNRMVDLDEVILIMHSIFVEKKKHACHDLILCKRYSNAQIIISNHTFRFYLNVLDTHVLIWENENLSLELIHHIFAAVHKFIDKFCTFRYIYVIIFSACV